MSLLPKHKIGDCSQCGDKNVACVKVGKDLFCLYNCHKNNKIKQQIDRASERNRIRTLPHNEDKEAIDSRNSIIQDLDYYYSRYIRILYSDNKGQCKCFTCTTVKHFSLMQNGHFVSRKHIGLRYMLKNQKPQCEYCNCNLHGNLEVYAANLNLEENGLSERLIEQSREVEKISTDELKQMLVDIKAKLKTVEQKLKKPLNK